MFNDIDEKTSPADISSMIGEELFKKEEVSPSPEPSAAPVESDIPAEVVPEEKVEPPAQENPAAPITSNFSGKPLPKAWKKDMEPVWQKLDPAVHDYVYEREANVMRGLQQYQTGYEQWNQVIQPFRHVMEQHPDVNPTQLLQNLMTNHLAVVEAPKAEKLNIVRNLIKGYGLDLAELVGQTPSPGADVPPEVQQLRGELQSIKAHLMQSQKTAYEKAVEAEQQKVNAFFSDPKNEYAEELTDDITRLIKTGVVDSLETAYEQACWINPVVRQKLLAKQRAEALGEVKKPKPTNIESTGEAPPRSRKPKDWQSGVDSIIHKHYGSTN